MKILDITPLAIPDVRVLRIQRYLDDRGYFLEVFRDDTVMENPDLPELNGKQLRQVNESTSRQGVVRGLHTQCNPNLDKLLRVLKGRIIDVAVDIRPNSPTFGKGVAYELTATPGEDYEEMILIPFGFAHGVMALEDMHIQYFQTGTWNNAGETTIQFSDTSIDWSLCEPQLASKIQEMLKNGILSDKDKEGVTLPQWREMPLAKGY